MLLQSPPQQFQTLYQLVLEYNEIAENNHAQKIFYLQKINWQLNKTPINASLYAWIDETNSTSFRSHLAQYKIDMDASFFLKGFQFAEAVAINKDSKQFGQISDNVYELMKIRDHALDQLSFIECQHEYLFTARQLHYLATHNAVIRESLQKHRDILELAKPKINVIKGRKPSDHHAKPAVTYKTTPLGIQGNNQNFILDMGEDKEKMVFRVEDRTHLSLEQRIHSHPAEMYLNEDYCLFWCPFQSQDSDIEFKLVVLSQFARQGNLADFAKQLKNKPVRDIAPQAKRFGKRLADFLEKLIQAKVYHPDIKLTNFLVDGNRLLVSDRKTFLGEETTLAVHVQSSPLYAPDEFLDCLNLDKETIDFKLKAKRTQLNLRQFMSYQLGMAMREFLLLTQCLELPEDFRDYSVPTASYFKNPTRPIINLSILIQELTRSKPENRMTISHFNFLLDFINQSPENFYKEVEKLMPSSSLGLEEDVRDIEAISKLLNDFEQGNSWQRSVIKFLNPAYYGNPLLNQANAILKSIATRKDIEDRLCYKAELLASKCYQEYSQYYFAGCANKIEASLLALDWKQASLLRKILHVLTFGLYRVDRIAEIKNLPDIGLDIHGEEFQSHFAPLEFLTSSPFSSMGVVKAAHLKDYLLLHLQEIIPESIEDRERPRETSSLSAESLPSGSMVVHEDLPEPSLGHVSLPADSVVIHSYSLSTGSVVIITDTDQDESQKSKGKKVFASVKGLFFKPQKNEAAQPNTTRKEKRIASVTTALTRLDLANLDQESRLVP